MAKFPLTLIALASLSSITGITFFKSNFALSVNTEAPLYAQTEESPPLEIIKGTDEDDNIVGKDIPILREYIYGYEGNDFIEGLSGREKLYGGRGNDEIHGGQSDDFIEGGAGQDLLYGDEGDDIISGDDQYVHDSVQDAQDDTLVGGTGNDELYSRQGSDTLIGWGGDNNEVDFLQGSTNINHKTIFVLGNQESGVFYAQNSSEDFAFIQNLDYGNVIQLAGNPDDYELVEIVNRPRSVTLVGDVFGIVYKPTDDLIAIVQTYRFRQTVPDIVNINMADSDRFTFVE